MGCIRTRLEPVTARKLKAEGSEQGVENRVNNEPSHPSRLVRERDAAPGGYVISMDFPVGGTLLALASVCWILVLAT